VKQPASFYSAKRSSRNIPTAFCRSKSTKNYHAIAAYRSEIIFPQTLQLHMEKGNPFYTMQTNAEKAQNTETFYLT
jgi:tRNA pseudouridine32 synthase/23S rRNA pseudouridine746 synthase